MSDLTVRRTVVVTDPCGLHARTALSVADLVRRSQSTVTLVKGERRVSGTDVLQVLTLYVPPGQSLIVEIVGPDALRVLAALQSLLAGADDQQSPETA
jgi:phosphotransferase system HPr (HPr) family protein